MHFSIAATYFLLHFSLPTCNSAVQIRVAIEIPFREKLWQIDSEWFRYSAGKSTPFALFRVSRNNPFWGLKWNWTDGAEFCEKNRFDGTANITAKIIFIDQNHQTNANAIAGFKLKTMPLKVIRVFFFFIVLFRTSFLKYFLLLSKFRVFFPSGKWFGTEFRAFLSSVEWFWMKL